MKKTLAKIVIGAIGLLVLAAIVMAGVRFLPSSIHSNVVYNENTANATMERISDTRPPLAAPTAHNESASENSITFTCNFESVNTTLPVD